jgi:DNA polymerase III epsilon subunit-like protein
VSIASCIIRDEHTPDLTARGFMRRHLHGGVVIDVPIADPVEHPDAMRYVREREAREAVYAPTSSVGSGVAVRCVCWHRSSGDHAADCPVADTGDLLPPWRDVTEVRREYRGTDATGRRVFAEVSSVVKRPPVERAAVVVEPFARPAPIIETAPEIVCVLDTETTGLKRGAVDGARITEVAVVAIDLAARKILGRFSELVNPGVPVPADITRLTGITDAMVRTAQPFEVVWPRVVAFVSKHALDIVAHNAAFDRGMLEDAQERAGHLSCDWPRWRWRCSKAIAQRVIPELSSYSLSGRPGHGPGLRETLKLPAHTSHRALGDVTTCSLLRVCRERAARPWSEWAGDAHV